MLLREACLLGGINSKYEDVIQIGFWWQILKLTYVIPLYIPLELIQLLYIYMFFEVIYIHNLDLIFLVTNILKKADLTLECWEFIWNDDLFG